MRLPYIASWVFRLVLLIVGASAHIGIIHPVSGDAGFTDDGNLSLVQTSTSDESILVVCSRELNAFCPPKTRCCPRYHNENKQLRGNGTGQNDTLTVMSVVGYTCLPSAVVEIPPGLCCADEQEGEVSTPSSIGSGCAVGYTCAAPVSTSNTMHDKDESASLMQVPHCVRDDSSTPIDSNGRVIDNRYELKPRYRTCPAFAMQDIATPFGLPIPSSATNYHSLDESFGAKASSDGAFIGKLAYFTNMGPLATSTSSSPSPNSSVKTAVIVIHGAGRDAQSQLCAMIAAIAEIAQHAPVSRSSSPTWIEDMFHPSAMSVISRRHLRTQNGGRDKDTTGTIFSEEGDILTIAPWFLSPADVQPKSPSDLSFLQWNDTFPVNDTFRYGAESMEVPIVKEDGSSEKMGTISSFAALDVLLETLCDKVNYPQLERIVVVGHSAGGQTVHRWGLTSESWCFGDNNEGVLPATELPSIRLVAANPRSYAYLDKRRYFPTVSITEHASILGDISVDGEDTLSPFEKLEFRLPTESELNDCQEYDAYIWGLEDSTRVPAPYVSTRVKKFMASGDEGRARLFCRYASRDVVYLSGERDTKELENEISNGDGYQGPSRRERSERFFASLQVLGTENLRSCLLSGGGLRTQSVVEDEKKNQVHRRVVVDNVGHDHSLIFQSLEGLTSIFSDPDHVMSA